MTIDVTTSEGRARELRNASLLQAKKKLAAVMAELSYLIMATPSGDRRNVCTRANIHAMSLDYELKKLASEEHAGDEMSVSSPELRQSERRTGWGDLTK